jgi:hypothetical protein
MLAALELVNSGYYVHIVRKRLASASVMAQLGKTFPANDGVR